MLLIFGGTTEGRLAVGVCEEAGKPFYYSTKGERQDVEMHNGVRLSGSMSANEMDAFCKEHGIRCIVDAAHPFAENLHREIAKVSCPVIRLQRTYSERRTEVTYCDGYEEAVQRLRETNATKVLALTGANTIGKLKPYWESHNTVFRILNREESISIAQRHGLPMESLIFYNDALTLPTKEEERQLLAASGCDCMITKESGHSGGYDTKIDAALELGIRVLVVKAPQLSYPWTYVTGKHGLRRAIERIVPDFFPLRTGLTTGACATAATKAALLSLLYGECPEDVSFALPDGEVLTIAVECNAPGTATVTKDFSDDPDVTKGCRITSVVTLNDSTAIRFLQGEGVGRATLPGLGIPVGEPAINPTPRAMMEAEIHAITTQGCDVTISVENGREIAQRTFNPKVGVVDGISIIGTSGIVSPLSNEAFVQSIGRELDVAKAIGCREIGLVSGMKSERMLHDQRRERNMPDIRCVHYGNFIGEALEACQQRGIESVTLAIMIGKAVKLAEGHMDTHSHKVQMNKDFLSSLAPQYADSISRITMARELWDFMPQSFFDKIKELCKEHCQSIYHGELIIDIKTNLS